MQTMGKEIGFIGKALRGLGSLGGSALGGLIGQPSAGAALGTGFGAAVSKYLGAGDYTVNRNTIVQKAASNIPMMHNNGQSVTVRHREFVATISGSVAFTVQQALYLNPGLTATFPWLAGIAARFQEYEFKGLVWHYVPTSGTFNGTTAALGAVMIQTTYRATDSNPNSKQEMLNEYCANETVPYETMAHPIECDPKENPFNVHYIRNAPITTGEQLLYDVGQTFVATQGMSDTSVVGELWCTYEVELKKPLINSPVVQAAQYFSTTFATPSTSSFFSGTRSYDIGAAPCTFATKTISFPAGSSGLYFINLQIVATTLVTHATAITWNGALTLTNCATASYNPVAVANVTTAISGTTVSTTNLSYSFAVYTTNSSLPFTILLPNASWTSGNTDYVSINIASKPYS